MVGVLCESNFIIFSPLGLHIGVCHFPFGSSLSRLTFTCKFMEFTMIYS